MSKRYIPPISYGKNKKPKLDVTVSDHSFPLSQNSRNKQDDVWGNDDEDEFLLLTAEQALAEAQIETNNTMLPDYSQFTPPVSTSTQMNYEPQPSTSKTGFSFKKPSTGPTNEISTNLRNKINTISSPLHRMSNNVVQNDCDLNFLNDLDDFIVNDNNNSYKGKNTDEIYKELLLLRNENSNLKMEKGELSEKYKTKEGEVKILRSQLTNSQKTLDHARLECVQTKEKMETENADKLSAAKSEIQNLRTQLDFKNLEIINMKAKCKMLESSKVKLTQVTISGNMSQRANESQHFNNNIPAPPGPHLTMSEVATECKTVQTDIKAYFVHLNRVHRSMESKLKKYLPIIFQETAKQQDRLLEFNEKLQKPQDFSQSKCRIFSTFHRIPLTPAPSKDIHNLCLSDIHEDLTYITNIDKEFNNDLEVKYLNIFKLFSQILLQLQTQLTCISQTVTAAFLREMDEKYMDRSAEYLHMGIEDLLQPIALYKEEQAILARRITVIISQMIDSKKVAELWYSWLKKPQLLDNSSHEVTTVDILNNICNLFDSTSCGVLYSGFFLSLVYLIEQTWSFMNIPELYTKIIDIMKYIITSRLMPVVVTRVLCLLRKLAVNGPILGHFCLEVPNGNLKMDYDQGVLLFRNDTCTLQILLKQVEVMLKAMESRQLTTPLVSTTQQLLAFYSNVVTHSTNWLQDYQDTRCNCALVMMQVMVYSLYLCSNALAKISTANKSVRELEAVCLAGVTVLYQWMSRDLEVTQLAYSEGHYHLFIENCEHMRHVIILTDVQGNMLTELVSSLQVCSEDGDSSPPEGNQAWIDSFATFSILD